MSLAVKVNTAFKDDEKNRTAIEMTKTKFARLMNRQVVWIIGSVSFVIGMPKALDLSSSDAWACVGHSLCVCFWASKI